MYSCAIPPPPTTTAFRPFRVRPEEGPHVVARTRAGRSRSRARVSSSACSATGGAYVPLADVHTMSGRLRTRGTNGSIPANGSCTQLTWGWAARAAASASTGIGRTISRAVAEVSPSATAAPPTSATACSASRRAWA